MNPTYLTGTMKAGDSTNIYWTGSIVLTVQKNVEGRGDTNQAFEFTIGNLTSGSSYQYLRYVTEDGTNWVPDSADQGGQKTADGSGAVSFALKHNQRIDFSIPEGSTVTITESEPGAEYIVSYRIDEGAVNEGKTTGQLAVEEGKTVVFTNYIPLVAPTSFTSRHTPFLLLLLFGILIVLLTGGWKYRSSLFAVFHSGTQAAREYSGPKAASRKRLNTTTAHTPKHVPRGPDIRGYKPGLTPDNIRVKEATAPPNPQHDYYGGTGQHSNKTAGNERPPCPRANLWETRSSTGKRGGAG